MKVFCRAALAAVAIGLISAAARDGFAASGGQMVLPLPVVAGQKPPKPSGLRLVIDSSWMASNGYRPVGIKIAALAPVTADRTLMIRLAPVEASNYYYQRSSDVAVTQQFDIPAQSSGVSGVIAMPQHAAWSQLKLDVFEDGEPVEDLSSAAVYLNPEGNTAYGSFSVNGASNAVNIGRSPTIMQIGGAGDEPYITQLLDNGLSPWSHLCVDPNGTKATSFGIYSNLANIATQPQIRSITDLPTRWIDYSGVDVFYVSLPKLKELVEKQPKQWAAIRLAVSAGANLWVYGVGQGFSRLKELDSAIETPNELESKSAGPSGGAQQDVWEPPFLEARFSSSVQPGTGDAQPKRTDRQSAPFLTRSFGHGQVVAIATVVGGGIPAFDWPWLLNTAGAQRLSWSARHGLVLDPDQLMDNKSDFWEFLIPGVGLTPVLQFQILISVFVILIGPVNYFLLKRWRRLGLLLITVPASAALVTLMLFGYAFIHDGLGVRVRVRSFTQLDLRRGEAVTWTRLSYYAGLSPSRGLTFPGDVAVYPYGQEPPPYRRGDSRAKEIRWQEAEPPAKDGLLEQHFSSDWLPSRTPTQFMTVRARKTTARMSITQSAPGAAPAIENRLGTRIHSIAVSDAAGNHFSAADIAAETTATLTPMPAADALKPIQKAVSDKDLQSPAAAQAARMQMPTGYYSRPYSSPYYSRTSAPQLGSSSQLFSVNSGPVSQHESVLERSLRDWSQSLGPRCFVAIVERSPEAVLGLDSVKEEASLHVVVGEW